MDKGKKGGMEVGRKRKESSRGVRGKQAKLLSFEHLNISAVL